LTGPGLLCRALKSLVLLIVPSLLLPLLFRESLQDEKLQHLFGIVFRRRSFRSLIGRWGRSGLRRWSLITQAPLLKTLLDFVGSFLLGRLMALGLTATFRYLFS